MPPGLNQRPQRGLRSFSIRGLARLTRSIDTTMKAILAVLIIGMVLVGCASGPVAHNEKPVAAKWSPPPFPSSPAPIPAKGHFGLLIPRYPYPEKRDGIYGEVLLEVVVDENHHFAAWKVVRATTEGYAKSVLATMSTAGLAPGVPAGVYLYSVVFNGEGEGYDEARPATFWVGAIPFGKKLSANPRSQGSSGPLSDRAIRAKLVGSWIVAFKHAGTSMDGTVTFSSDGRLVGEAVFSRGSERCSVTYKAKWAIEDSTLVETVTDASDPAMIGQRTRDRIVYLDDDQYIYRTERSEVVKRMRQKDQQR